VKEWVEQTLKPAAAHLFAEAPTLPAALIGKPTETLTWAHEHGLVPVHDRQHRRPVYRTMTPAEVKALDAEGLPWADRHTKARQMQQTPAPQQE
jgi:hypothetical protein